MNFIKMIEELIIKKTYEIKNDTLIGVLVNQQTCNEYLVMIKADDEKKWRMGVSYATDEYLQEDFAVIGPLDYYTMLFRYIIYKNEEQKESYILPIDREEKYQLDKKISRKRIFTNEFKTLALYFANDLKNEREYLDYLLYNLAHLKIEVLEKFVELDEDAKRVVVLTQ